MGGSSSTPCQDGGGGFCSKIPYAVGCENGNGSFWCSCSSGFMPRGSYTNSECIDIDECASASNSCRAKNAECVNTPGSYECGCGRYRESIDGICKDINECLKDKGGCDINSDCINGEGAPPTCQCHPGWTGNDNKPGGVCRDINECNENPSICPSSSICSNTPGSYKCECGPGFVGDSTGTGCVTEDFCRAGKDDCDKMFASCSLVPGSFKCECLDGFHGTGTINSCDPLSGNEGKACEILGQVCGNYSRCERSSDVAGRWQCNSKSAGEQLTFFLSNGATDDTPGWVWAVVVVSVLLLLILAATIIWCLYKRFTKKSDEDSEALNSDMGEGYSYGAIQGTYA